MSTKTMVLLTTAVLVLAACERHAPPKPASAGKAPAVRSVSFRAGDAISARFGPKVFTHDVVKSETGTAACGYYSPTDDPKSGVVFVFSNGRLVTADDAKPDAFRAQVEHECPDFVLRTN